ncbi:hypothetical protein GCM10008941_05800 [Rhizomicrobium palustre]
MGKGSQRFKAEHRARAFQRMHGAEDLSYKVGIAGAIFKIEQALFDLVKELLRLDAEDIGGI